ncbi:MAG: hypothetical protein LW701_00850, partial [Fluviicola sp.]|nr:hypothetical protein [Fluviicola sp.]
MKKYIIIGLLLLIVGSMIIKPFLTGGDSSEISATFEFKENLATVWNKQIDLKINVNSDDIEKLELIYNDSVFKTWTKPSSQIVFPFNASY